MKDEIAGPAIDDISEVWHYLLYVLFCFSLDLLPPYGSKENILSYLIHGPKPGTTTSLYTLAAN